MAKKISNLPNYAASDTLMAIFGFKRVKNMKNLKPQKSIKLIPNYVYQLDDGRLVVFKHIGGTGFPVFNPVCEPSFQDCFIFSDDWRKYVIKKVRKATKKDLNYD